MSGPERIVCLTEETVETLYLLGASDRIVGVTGYAVRPPKVRQEKPRVGAFTSADADKIAALNPDLVLTFSDLQADIAAELIRKGFAVHAFNQRGVDGIFEMIRTLGALVDKSAAAQNLIQSLKAGLAAKQGPAETASPLRVYFEEWDGPMIAGIKWVSELIEMAGAIDVFADKAKEQDAKGRFVTSDEVIAAAPDVIVASWCGKKVRPERIAQRPGWDQIPAVQNGHIFEIKSPMILAPGPAALTDGYAALVDAFRKARLELEAAA